MRFALVTPGNGVKGKPFIIIEPPAGPLLVLAEDRSVAEKRRLDYLERKVTDLETATSGMSYYNVTIGQVTPESMVTLRGVASQWGSEPLLSQLSIS